MTTGLGKANDREVFVNHECIDVYIVCHKNTRTLYLNHTACSAIY